MPGENLELVLDLVHDVPIEVGTRFTLREGGKTSKHSFSPSKSSRNVEFYLLQLGRVLRLKFCKFDAHRHISVNSP